MGKKIRVGNHDVEHEGSIKIDRFKVTKRPTNWGGIFFGIFVVLVIIGMMNGS